MISSYEVGIFLQSATRKAIHFGDLTNVTVFIETS